MLWALMPSYQSRPAALRPLLSVNLAMPIRLLFHARVTEEAIAEHADVLAALKAGDPGAARAAMERHILYSQRRMAPIFESLE
jgi:DNA-binding GntR family transcriptional regulator